jgi:hypothetical protein
MTIVMRKAGVPTGAALPLRLYLTLAPSFPAKLERREEDRKHTTAALRDARSRIDALEAHVRNLELRLAALETTRRDPGASPHPAAPPPRELRGLPGFSRGG